MNFTQSSHTSNPKGDDPDLSPPSGKEYHRKTPLMWSTSQQAYRRCFTRPNKTCQIKILIFLGILVPQTRTKTDSLRGKGSNNLTKHQQENPSLGLRLQTQISLPHSSNKERREYHRHFPIGQMIAKPKRKGQFPAQTKKSETRQFLKTNDKSKFTIVQNAYSL